MSSAKKTAEKNTKQDRNKQKEQIKSLISSKLRRHYAKTVETATPSQLYKACALTVQDQIMEKWAKTREKLEIGNQKELYYLSFEFLMGRALGNNIMNLVQADIYKEALKDFGLDISSVEEV